MCRAGKACPEQGRRLCLPIRVGRLSLPTLHQLLRPHRAARTCSRIWRKAGRNRWLAVHNFNSRFASGTRSPAYSMRRVPFGIILFANTPLPSIRDRPTRTKSLFVCFMAILICQAMVVTFICNSAQWERTGMSGISLHPDYTRFLIASSISNPTTDPAVNRPQVAWKADWCR